MRRWLSIFLLIILSLQMSWAVAASYCQHEAGGAQHFGHHEHTHQAAGGEQLADETSLSADNDCPLCHAASVAALPSFGASLPDVLTVADYHRRVRPLPSIPGDQPERPNWDISA